MDAAVAAHITAKQRLQALAAAIAKSKWDALPGYDRRNVDQYLSQALPLLQGANLQSVALTEAYLAHVLGRQPLGVDAGTVAAGIRNGATPEEVYSRPFVTVWSALSQGKAFADAVAIGGDRAASAAATDVQLAFTGTLREVGRVDDRIIGYERVPDGGACDLCLMASTQRYHSEDLLPIHNRCSCGVAPLASDRAVSARGVSNPDLLRELKQSGRAGDLSLQQGASRARARAAANRARAEEWRAEAAQESGARAARLLERAYRYEARAVDQESLANDYAQRRTERLQERVAVHEHGELGPVLTPSGEHFTSEHQIAA